MVMRRLAVLVVSGALLLPAPAAVAAPERPSERGITVAAVVATPSGRYVVRREPAASAALALRRAAEMRAQPGVVDAGLDVAVQAAADPQQPSQWGLTAVRAPQVWPTASARGQVVAVIDSGVDLDHPDLAGVLLPGYDVVDGDTVADDVNGHGTHVAGIVGAVAGNGVGGAGVAQGVRVLPVRVLGRDGGGSGADVAAGIRWAVDRGATVLNLSLGSPDDSSLLSNAVSYALDKGVTVVAAAGNEGSAAPMWPAAQPGVLAVGAVAEDGTLATFSNRGPHVSLVAPGVGIVSTLPGGQYGSMSGTSMATPFVAGAAAVLRTSSTPSEVAQRLTSTAVDAGPPGRDDSYGHGRLDLFAAATAGSVVRGPRSAYVPVRPVRILDTRNGYSPLASPKGRVRAGQALTLQVAGTGAVPAEATAVVLNVTAVEAASDTHVTVYPAGAPAPTASNLNLQAGETVPNLVTVKTGDDGSIVLRNSAGAVDLVADLAGYYVPEASGGLGFQPLVPRRVLDTRAGYAPLTSPKGRVPSGAALDVVLAGAHGVPADAAAVVLNLTGVAPSAATHVTAYPSPSTATVPDVSTLNLAAGATAANLAVVPVGEQGKVRFRNHIGDVDLVVDVVGYFSRQAPGRFVPVDPLRLLDTRNGTGAPAAPVEAGRSLALAVAGRRGLPDSALAAVLNTTGVSPTSATHVTVYPDGTVAPNASALNLDAGDVRANAVVATLGGTSGAVRLRNQAGAVHLVADLSGWFEP